jgi:hypothetical protein
MFALYPTDSRPDLIDKFPLPLFVRTLAFGAILGTVEGGLRIAQAKIGSLRAADDVEESPTAV